MICGQDAALSGLCRVFSYSRKNICHLRVANIGGSLEDASDIGDGGGEPSNNVKMRASFVNAQEGLLVHIGADRHCCNHDRHNILVVRVPIKSRFEFQANS